MIDLTSIATRDFLADALDNGVVLVMFEKANGDRRLMLCTTDQTRIDIEDWPNPWPENGGDTFTVYDIEKEAWRRFRFSRVESIFM